MAQPHLAPGARLTKVKLRNSQGEEIGEIKEWMMDIEEGKVIYVLASITNLNNEDYVALPWQVLKADLNKGGYELTTDLEKIKNAPNIKVHALDEAISNNQILDNILNFFELNQRSENKDTQNQTGIENVEHSEGKGGYGHS